MLKECPLLSKLVRMQTYRETLPELAGEINRARRYRRPLSVAVIQFEASGGPCAVIRHADARVRGYKRVQVEPHQSVTAACSAEWVPIRPKTDPAFMFALMHVLMI
jgi:hypothetical protein